MRPLRSYVPLDDKGTSVTKELTKHEMDWRSMKSSDQLNSRFFVRRDVESTWEADSQ